MFRRDYIRFPDRVDCIIPVPDFIWWELLERERSGEYVFLSPVTGKPYDNIRKAWTSLLRMAEIEGCRFHDLRHTAGTRLAERTDIGTVMEILGHSNITTTKRYLNPGLERKRQALNQAAGEFEEKD